MKNKTILFLPSNANHVKIFYPVSNLLEKKYRVLYIGQGSFKDEGAENELENHKIPFKKFDEYSKQEPKSIIEKENVGLIVIGNDTDVIPQWFVNVAKKMEIPSVLLQDGVLFDYKANSNKTKSFLKLSKSSTFKLKRLSAKLLISKQFKHLKYGTAGCSQIHVWGEASRSYLENKRIDRKKIMITGSIHIKKIIKNSEIKNNSKTILYAPSDLVFSNIIKTKEFQTMIETVCSAVSSFKEVKFVIKPHPRENNTIFERIAKKYDFVTLTSNEIYPLLKDADIVITDLSSIAIESLVTQLVTIIFFPKIENVVEPNSFPFDLIVQRSALLSKDKTTLTQQLSQILAGKQLITYQTMLKSVHYYLGPMDEKEAERSANLIQNLIN